MLNRCILNFNSQFDEYGNEALSFKGFHTFVCTFMTIFSFILENSDLQSLVSLSHGEDFVSGVDSAQFAERTEQPLAGPAVELQLLVVVLRAGQNLRRRGSLKIEPVPLSHPSHVENRRQATNIYIFEI